MDAKPLRFTNPGVLSPDREPVPLEHFRDSLPSRVTIEVIQEATRILGSENAATQWLHTSSLGLNHRRPVDLLATHPELVNYLLTNLEHVVAPS